MPKPQPLLPGFFVADAACGSGRASAGSCCSCGSGRPAAQANPRFFTASSPTVDTVNAFLHQVWGSDPNRLYRVMAIQPTTAPNVTKVVVFVTERTGKPADAKVQAATFFVTPDGKHAIGEGWWWSRSGPRRLRTCAIC